MAAEGAGAGADLLGLGEHCSWPSCQQIDFLPFTCDCCNKTYCLDHRRYESHSCSAAGSRSSEVIVCPLCAKGVKLLGRDANVAFDEHQREGTCDSANWRRVNAKPRCPVKGCREKLTTINTYACKRCSQRVSAEHAGLGAGNPRRCEAPLPQLPGASRRAGGRVPRARLCRCASSTGTWTTTAAARQWRPQRKVRRAPHLVRWG